MSAIQLFRPHYRVEETLAAIRECLECGWTGLGFRTIAFEAEWKAYTGLPHAHFVNSASAGLELALRLMKHAYGWQDGDEVITTPLTFVSTNHAIVHAGLRPVFADVDKYLCLDVRSMKERVTPRTRAVMFVGLGGSSGEVQRLTHDARALRLRTILDAAHCAGTRLTGWGRGLTPEHIGGQFDAAVFSFQAVKNLPTADSGMVCMRDEALDRRARAWSWCGISKTTYDRTVEPVGGYRWQYDVDAVGFKMHGNSIMAAIGLVALKYLDEDNARRRAIAAIYDAELSLSIGRVPMPPDCIPSRHLYQIVVDRRDEVMATLNARDIFGGVHYALSTDYPMYAYGRGMCPQAERASARLLSLPLHLGLTDDDALRVARAVNEAVDAAT